MRKDVAKIVDFFELCKKMGEYFEAIVRNGQLGVRRAGERDAGRAKWGVWRLLHFLERDAGVEGL